MTPHRTYAPSGRFDPHALITVPLVGGLAGAALAALYSVATLFLPIVGMVSFILTAATG
jgi:hypothetical protein